ncbi:iron complex outermembrane receptor protein [Alteromonadaceae bacterium 2753L.S.0a.02]|nr:iron complex outermembrane receptor protein [Alteromonadaceae bacterium 2753L.S.0a.02]
MKTRVSSRRPAPSAAKKHFSPTLLSLAVASACATNISLAQQVEEVIVTTERRSQSIQDVAGTVQAFSAAELEKFGVSNDYRTLQNAVTGLHISNQEGKLEVYLRGIGSSDSDFASDPSVATHYNGIYLPRPRSIGPMFFDVQRVEVNKGPQGTLRGRNATGGTINIISNKPNLDEFEASIKLGAGNYNRRHLEGVVNLPMGNTFAARLAVYDETADSYMSNAFEGSKEAFDNATLNGQLSRIETSLDAPGKQDDSAVRLSATWEATDNFSAFFLGDYVKQRGSSLPGAFSGRALSAGYDIKDLDDPYNQYFVNQGEMKNDIYGLATVLTYDFGDISLEYNGSYREYEFRHRNAAREWQIGMDYPGARDEAEAVILENEQTAYGNFTQNETSTTLVNELRAYSHDDQRLRWSAGIFSMQETYSNSSQDFNHGWWGDCDGFQEGTNCGWLNGLSSENRNDDSEVISLAGFADGTFDVTDRFRLKAGIRYTEDEKTANESNAQYQLVVTDEAIAAARLDGPEDIVMGTTGLQLTAAGKRPNVVVPLGNSAATRQYFLDGIERWGNNDNLDQVIAAAPEDFQVVISSDFERDIDGDGNPDPGTGNISKKHNENYIDWRFGGEFDFTADQMVYGTISTGTRAGGINRPLPGNNADVDVTWEPEELVVYEVGSKNQFGALRLNGAAFYYDYKNKVLQGLVGVTEPCESSDTGFCTTNFVQNQNAASASILGFEFDGGYAMNYGFDFTWNLAYIDSKIDNGLILDTRQPGEVLVDVSGNQLPNTSKWNLNLAISQNIDVDWGFMSSIDWSLTSSYRSEFYLSIYNNEGFDSEGNPTDLSNMTINNHWLITGAGFDEANGNFLSDKVDATNIVNFNAGANFGSDEQFRVEAWVSNLTEETYSTKAFINDSVNIRFLNVPRMYGVRFIAKI